MSDMVNKKRMQDKLKTSTQRKKQANKTLMNEWMYE